MKKTEPTRKQFNAYAKAFAYFIRELFEGMLPPCFLNFSRHKNPELLATQQGDVRILLPQTVVEPGWQRELP